MIDTTVDDSELDVALQQRADYIPLDDLARETSSGGDLFQKIGKELTNNALRTIEGPRGCGKTHMMRYAWLQCRKSANKPFAIYVSFNRYFRLERLLSSRADALGQFHSWVLAKVLIALYDNARQWSPAVPDISGFFEQYGFPLAQLNSFVDRTERNGSFDEVDFALSNALSIRMVQEMIDFVRESVERRHTVLLMDDAALTLTPHFLSDFLDIVRSLKSSTLAPKISVYPGTTEVSSKFHQGQDSIAIPAWIAVTDPKYNEIMQDIAEKRVKRLPDIPQDVQAMCRFAAFGIARAYLTMLDEYQRGSFRTSQQGINKIIQAHLDARLEEFNSLAKKVPKFDQLIDAGEKMLDAMAKEIKSANRALAEKSEKQLIYGVASDELTTMITRMFKLLEEAGLIYDAGTVKHGAGRNYRLYIPHTALLLALRALTTREAGGAIKHTLAAIEFKSTKHPVRKSLASLKAKVKLDKLNFSLPKCGSCGTPRLADNQHFCHQCGHQLVDASTFNQCLEMEIAKIPGLTVWQKLRIANNLTQWRTVRDFLAVQNPAAELFTITGFGKARTAKIVDVINSFVDDYLS